MPLQPPYPPAHLHSRFSLHKCVKAHGFCCKPIEMYKVVRCLPSSELRYLTYPTPRHFWINGFLFLQLDMYPLQRRVRSLIGSTTPFLWSTPRIWGGDFLGSSGDVWSCWASMIGNYKGKNLGMNLDLLSLRAIWSRIFSPSLGTNQRKNSLMSSLSLELRSYHLVPFSAF